MKVQEHLPTPTPAPTPAPAVKQEAEFKLVDETGTPITDLTGLEVQNDLPQMVQLLMAT